MDILLSLSDIHMRTFIQIVTLCFITNMVTAQIIDPAGTAHRKATDRANRRVDQTIDKGLDKMEEGIGSIFKKKEKKEPESEEPSKSKKSKADTTGEENTIANDQETNTNDQRNGALKAYSRFDFVPGEKILYFDNFDRVEIGDFPADFNTDASGEVVKIDGKNDKWLNMTKNGVFIPENIKQLPENCTIEFEIGIQGTPSPNMRGVGLVFKTEPNELFNDGGLGSFLYLHPDGSTSEINIEQADKPTINNTQRLDSWNITDKSFIKISIWKQKSRLRIYANENKIWDLPRFFPENKPYYFALNRSFFYDCNVFLTNFKYAIGQPDTRNKLLTEGKFVTNGILFDVNSARIRAESYGVLKEIANVLTENASLKVRISGHTDSDGDDKANLELSQKRSAAVKEVLSKDFGVDPSRMSTEGLGESKPVDSNATTVGKANNRRVEFTKI